MTLRKGWREGIMAWSHRDHMTKLMLDSEQFQQEHDIDETKVCTWSTTTTLEAFSSRCSDVAGRMLTLSRRG